VFIPRYDNDNTGKVTFKVTMSKPASSVSFPIYGVDWHWGLDKVTVLGKLSGGNVTPKLSKAWYSWVDLSGNQASGRDYLHGGYSFLSTAYVNFDAPIDEFTVEYVKTTTYPTWKIYNYIGIGAVDVACAPVIPEVITPDNVYVFKQATPDSAKAGSPFVFKYTVQNLNCDNKTISLSDVLPAGMTYVDSTLATSLAIGTVNNYGSSQNLSLSTITVPKGTSYIYIGVKGNSAGTYNSQANYNVTGGGSYVSDDPKLSGSMNPTRVVILAGDPLPNLSVVKSVDKSAVRRDSMITYTYTVTNNGATAINTYLEDALYSAATFVSGSLTNAPAGVQLGAYGNTSTLLMRDLNIAAGATKTFSIRVNVGQMAIDSVLKTSAKVTPDYQAAYQPVTTASNAPPTQIVAMAADVVVAPKAILSGSYVSATGMMHDSLRVRGYIPSAQPYTSMGYAGAETVIPAVLATTGANAIVDWVLIQLRSDTSTVLAQQAALIQRDGDIVSTDGVSPLTFAGVSAGNYYVVVKHRNHLGVMTANALSLSATLTAVDFTIAATPNFQRGGNFGSIYAQRTMGSVRTLWSGNTGGGNTIKAAGAGSDGESVLFKVLLDAGNADMLPTFILYNGYFREDGNLDGKVIYQGANSETDMMLFSILLHGGNSSVLANFVIYEQIP
jgi:uncharacterized repeat protein (TIGR01451 family)